MLFFLGFAAAGCRRTGHGESAINLKSVFSPEPAHVGVETVTVILSDSSSKPVIGATVELEGDMSHAGMAPVFGSSTEAEPGIYKGKLTLSMAGDWAILFHVTLPGGAKIERQIAVAAVRAN